MGLKSATKITLLTLIFTLAYLSIAQIPINDTFKNTLQLVVAFYFGQKVNELKNGKIE